MGTDLLFADDNYLMGISATSTSMGFFLQDVISHNRYGGESEYVNRVSEDTNGSNSQVVRTVVDAYRVESLF